jgi:negative regulator of flagellin synthesis FlgM
MEIDGKNPLVGLNANFQRIDAQSQYQKAPLSSEESSKSENDRIELSVRSREIQHLDELIQSTPDIREAKVDQIRSAIENGTYNVKAEKIADKMIGGNLLDEVF